MVGVWEQRGVLRGVRRTRHVLEGSTERAGAHLLLQERLAKIPNVMTAPAPDVTLLDFTLAGPVLAVRPYCHTDHYWQVYFDTNEVIREVCGELGVSVPSYHYHVRGQLQDSAAPAQA